MERSIKFLQLIVVAFIAMFLMSQFAFANEVIEQIGFIDKLIDWYNTSFPTLIATITSIVTAASAITAITPTQVDNKVVDAILRVLNWVSLNILKNKNADDVKEK